MPDLRSFTLRDMSELGSALRRLGDGAPDMAEAAKRIVRHLYEHLADAEGQGNCALVRFFRTQRYADLDARLRELARAGLPGQIPAPHMKSLVLLGTVGDEPAWNSPRASLSHQAIPLVSKEMVSRAPMISSLLQQLGVEVETLLNSSSALLVESGPSSFNVFYVPDASESPYIPDQESFVEASGIASVLGFGGSLPQGDIFAVILFSKVAIPRDTAELFRTLALNVKMAVLPFVDAPPQPGNDA